MTHRELAIRLELAACRRWQWRQRRRLEQELEKERSRYRRAGRSS
jgi:hypothetical protein